MSQELEERMKLISTWATGIQQEVTRLMKDLERLSAPNPSGGRKGKKNAGPLTQEQLNALKAARLRKIKVN